MGHRNPTQDQIREILAKAKTIALVGASSKPERVSYRIMEILIAAGYRVIPVNPNEEEVLGQKAHRSLREIEEPVDIVNVFRRAGETPPIASDAVATGATALWLQS